MRRRETPDPSLAATKHILCGAILSYLRALSSSQNCTSSRCRFRYQMPAHKKIPLSSARPIQPQLRSLRLLLGPPTSALVDGVLAGFLISGAGAGAGASSSLSSTALETFLARDPLGRPPLRCQYSSTRSCEWRSCYSVFHSLYWCPHPFYLIRYLYPPRTSSYFTTLSTS